MDDPKHSKRNAMNADIDRAFARLYTEANDFALWADQNGTDYAVARLHTALANYYKTTEEQQ